MSRPRHAVHYAAPDEAERLRQEVAELRAANAGLSECLTALSEAADLMNVGLSDLLESLASEPDLQAKAAAAIAPATARIAQLFEMLASRFPAPQRH